MAGTRRATLREASEVLGVSIEAVRKRVKRGSLKADKGPDGRVYVYLDEGGDASHPQPSGEASAQEARDLLYEEMRERIAYLERQLDVRTEELKEHRRLLAGLIERVPELEPAQDTPQGAPEAHQEAPEARETVEEAPEGAERPAAPGPQEGARRPWWRRVFGG